MNSLITRTAASQMLSLFDYAFKKGVLDAADMRDDHYCSEFIRKREATATFGVLDSDYDMDWREWKLVMNRWCSSGRMCHLYTNFIDKINRPSYAMAAVCIVQDFYLMGIKEWLEYPNPLPIQVFKTQGKMRWKPVNGKSLSKVSNRDIIAKAQEFAYERSHKSSGIGDKVSPKAYEIFSSEIWRATRPIPKVVIDDDF